MLKQQLQLKLTQKLSPQQIQLMKLVQLSTLELEQRVKQELEENPALESSSEEDVYDKDEFEDEFNNSEEDYDDREIIEADAINVDEYLSKYLIKGVTENLSYDILKVRFDIPCSRSVYYKKYRYFFALLDLEAKKRHAGV